MKRISFLLIWLLVISFFTFVFADYVPGQIIVKFKPGVVSVPRDMRVAAVSAATVRASSIQALNAKYRVARIRQLNRAALNVRPDWTHLENKFVLVFPKDQNVLQVVADYQNDPNVLYAEPDGIVRAFATTPNDPRYVAGDQYGLDNINAPLAWDRTTGSSSITIAVMDTGIDYNHEDFSGRINLSDAYDFVNNDTDVMDDHSGSHGTTVSGVIGAATNNGIGVAGVDWQAQILPIKVLDNNGNGSVSDIDDGVSWARSKGADIINMSFGQYDVSVTMQQACQNAYNDGIILVAAAGNGGVDWATYPASYSTVIAVAAVDQNDVRSFWGGVDPNTGQQQASNYGTWVDVCAPGTDIWTTSRNDSYKKSNGTSLASPFVAGLAGLVKAANPTATNQQIMDKISSEAEDIDSLNPGFEGKLGKRIDAYLAVAGIVARITAPTSDAYVKGTLNILGSASGWDFSSYVLEALQGSSLVTTIESSTTSIESGTLGSWDTTGINGQHTIRLRVFSTGVTTDEVTVSIYVDNTVPAASISSPISGATVGGQMTVVGTAEDQYFNTYVLSYGQGAAPSSYEIIQESYVTVSAGSLGVWETAGLSGEYTIKLVVSDKAGTTSTKTVLVTLQNTGTVTKEAEPQAGFPITYTSENPFNRSQTSEITFNYTLSANFDTKIYLFDLGGNLLWQNSYAAGDDGGKSGENNPAWNGADASGTNVPNGVYLYQIIADQRPLARGKIIILN